MGVVSYAEDNEELRLHHQQLSEKIEKIKEMVANAAVNDPNTVEKQIHRFIKRMVDELDKVKEQVDAAFLDAQKFLRNPNVRILNKLDKKVQHVERLQKELKKARADLATCRAKQNEAIKLQREFERTKIENKTLREKLEWSAEMQSVRPIRRK